MGKVLNKYFTSVFTAERHEDWELGKDNGDVLRIVLITVREMLDDLKRMKLDKSLGISCGKLEKKIAQAFAATYES